MTRVVPALIVLAIVALLAATAGQSTTETPDPYRDWRFGVTFVEDDVIVHASAPGDQEWRTMLTVTRPNPDTGGDQ